MEDVWNRTRRQRLAVAVAMASAAVLALVALAGLAYARARSPWRTQYTQYNQYLANCQYLYRTMIVCRSPAAPIPRIRLPFAPGLRVH